MCPIELNHKNKPMISTQLIMFSSVYVVFFYKESYRIFLLSNMVFVWAERLVVKKKSCVWSPFVYTTTTSILNGITPMQHLRDNLWVRQTIHRWLETNSNSIKCESRDWELHWTRLVGNSVLRGKTKLINCLENKFKYWNR